LKEHGICEKDESIKYIYFIIFNWYIFFINQY
jgi:hypothetical protein